MSPTQRSLKLLRERGCLAEVVERWNAFSRTRKDLFQWIDILAIEPVELGLWNTIAIQTTTKNNMKARITKITESDTLNHVRKAGWLIEVHGWKKRRGKWEVEIVDLS